MTAPTHGRRPGPLRWLRAGLLLAAGRRDRGRRSRSRSGSGLGWTVAACRSSVCAGIVVLRRAARAAVGASAARSWRPTHGAGAGGSRARGADLALVIAGALLLVVPGFVTAVAGILLVVPLTRRVRRPLLGAAATRLVAARCSADRSGSSRWRSGGGGRRPGRRRPGRGRRAPSGHAAGAARRGRGPAGGRRREHRVTGARTWRRPRRVARRGPCAGGRRRRLGGGQALRRWVSRPLRSSSSRSARSSSSSAVVRRSMSMSQWVRAGLTGLASGPRCPRAAPSAPQRHSHSAGTSASTDSGTTTRVPVRAVVRDVLPRGRLDARCRSRGSGLPVGSRACSGRSSGHPPASSGSRTRRVSGPPCHARRRHAVHRGFAGPAMSNARGKCSPRAGPIRRQPLASARTASGSDDRGHLVAGLDGSRAGRRPASSRTPADDEEHHQRDDREPVGVGQLVARGRRAACRTSSCRVRPPGRG